MSESITFWQGKNLVSHVATPTVWNSLPADIRACTFYGSFIRQLKTFYFNNAC